MSVREGHLKSRTSTAPDGTVTHLAYRAPAIDRVPWMSIASALLAGALVLGSVADQLPPKLAIPAGTIVTIAGILGRVAYRFASQPVLDVVRPADLPATTVINNNAPGAPAGD